MSAAATETCPAAPARAERDALAREPRRPWWRAAEDGVLTLLLSAMIALPLVEIGLRQFSTGIPSAPEFLRHLTLLVGMAGSAIAAREGRLLALASSTALAGGVARFGRLFADATAVAISALLCAGSARFVAEERRGGAALAYDIPLWCIQLAMPLGFALIALRLALRASEQLAPTKSAPAKCHPMGDKLRPGLFALILAASATVGAAAAFAPTWVGLGGLLLATFFGAPIFVTLGGAALILFWGDHVPISAVAIQHYGLVTNPALPAIPLFTLAGYFMAEGGASRRLVRVFQALCGWLRGGPAIATALICAFFTAFTGGSGVTILALGGLLMPVLTAARFSERNALGLITGAGSLGILLPPCLPVILYAIIAKVDINTMFLGGLIPAILLVALTAAWGVWASRKSAPARNHFHVLRENGVNRPTDGQGITSGNYPALQAMAAGNSFHVIRENVPARFDAREAASAMWAAKWELLMPVVSLALLFSGWATPVEAAAATAAYAFLIEVVIHRDLRVRDCGRVMTEAGLLIGGILLILGVALGLTSFLIDAQVPNALADWSLTHVKSRWLFLLGLNLILIIVGSVVEIFAAIIVIAPLLVPIGARLGIDPIHLGIIFLANMELGFLAPPVGLNLLLASSRLKRPVSEVARATLPLLLVMFIGVLLITYVPALTTFLPGLFP